MEKLKTDYSSQIESLKIAISKETDFQNKWHLEDILRYYERGGKDKATAPYIPMMP